MHETQSVHTADAMSLHSQKLSARRVCMASSVYGQ